MIACARDLTGALLLSELSSESELLQLEQLDVTDFNAIDQLACKLEQQPIDILINNAGIFGPKQHSDNDPGQTLGFIDYKLWGRLLKTNTMAPLKMAEALYKNLQQSQQKKIINISSRAGSFSEGQTELFMYKTSKAALNMVTKVLGDKTADTGVIATAISPGWVKTDMGGAEANLEIEESIRALIKTISELTEKDTGSFLGHNGEVIPW